MQKSNKAKLLGKLGILYGLVIVSINFLGYMIASSSSMPTNGSKSFEIWVDFIENHTVFNTVFAILSFVLPSIICVAYTLPKDKGKVETRIINLPIIYAIFGSLGWFISLFLETVTLIVLKINGNMEIKDIFTSSALNICQICLFISTFAFLILDVVHRKVVLPKHFPDGKVTQYPGVIHFSSSGLITIFYLSIGIFPIVFLVSTLYSYSIKNNFDIELGLIIVLAIIVVFGIGMTIFFSDHFASPLRKLKYATKEMTNSNYEVSVDVVSNDDFGDLADNFNDMALSLSDKSKKILAIQDSIIKGMAIMVEQRDNSTGGHISRTSDCVRVFMNSLKGNDDFDFSHSFRKAVIKAAPMHDLGKIAVDDAVLRKPGRFTDEEYAIMKKHAAAGKVIVERVLSEVDDEEFKNVAVNVAHYHHEKWNGTGYPTGIKGEDIPVEARIMALADVFDALVSKRCYKDKMSYDKAFDIIKGDLGTHFDPNLGEMFIKCRPELEKLYDSYDPEG